jgi:hypothetical protein
VFTGHEATKTDAGGRNTCVLQVAISRQRLQGAFRKMCLGHWISGSFSENRCREQQQTMFASTRYAAQQIALAPDLPASTRGHFWLVLRIASSLALWKTTFRSDPLNGQSQ